MVQVELLCTKLPDNNNPIMFDIIEGKCRHLKQVHL